MTQANKTLIKIAAVLVILFLCAVAYGLIRTRKAAFVQAPTAPIPGMHLTFDDEFNSFSEYVDANGNADCASNGTGTWQTLYYNCSNTDGYNDEEEEYTDRNPDPFIDANGVLNIEVQPSTPGQPLPYTSGMITTQYSFTQEYGYFEMRAKLPAGRGIWPAFWLLPADESWPPEIDAMEAFGATNTASGEGGPTMIHYASHFVPEGQICGAWYDTATDTTAGFHTYGVDWEPDSITYYFDGKSYASCPGNPAANKPFYMLVNVAVGGTTSWPGPTDSTDTFPQYMSVDYVRAYQKN